MKTMLLALMFAMAGASASAATLPPDLATTHIERAIQALQPLARSGISEFQIARPERSVKKSLLALALQEQLADSEADFNWDESGKSAWYPDGNLWAQTDMANAYAYVLMLEEDEDMTKQEAAREKAAARQAFDLLQNTGVQFGVAPLGAVQCGVRFAGLAIVNPHNGKIYIFAREGSGC